MEIKQYAIATPGGAVDLPLPGFYPCLTWQLNFTVHQATGLAKWVGVMREPNDHIEVIRSFEDLGSFSSRADSCRVHTAEVLRALGYLSGLTTGV